MTMSERVKAAILAVLVTALYWSLPFLSDFLAFR